MGILQGLGIWEIFFSGWVHSVSNQTNAILQYKLLASILSAVCSVIQQS